MLMDNGRNFLSHVARSEFGGESDEEANVDKYADNLLRRIRQGRLDGAEEKNVQESGKAGDGLSSKEIEEVLMSENSGQAIPEEENDPAEDGFKTGNIVSESERAEKERILDETALFYGRADKQLEKEKVLVQIELFYNRASELDGKFNSDEQPFDVTKYGRLNGELSVLGKDIVAFAETLNKEQMHDEKISPRLDELIDKMFHLRGLVGWADKL